MSNGSMFTDFADARPVARARVQRRWARLYPGLQPDRWYDVLSVGRQAAFFTLPLHLIVGLEDRVTHSKLKDNIMRYAHACAQNLVASRQAKHDWHRTEWQKVKPCLGRERKALFIERFDAEALAQLEERQARANSTEDPQPIADGQISPTKYLECGIFDRYIPISHRPCDHQLAFCSFALFSHA